MEVRYGRRRRAVVAPSGVAYAVGHHRGRLLLLWTDAPLEPPGGARIRVNASAPQSIDAILPSRFRPPNARSMRFQIEDADLYGLAGPRGSLVTLFIPAWALMAVALLGPARRIVIVLRERRRERRGQCAACGYDLRGSPGPCAECGLLNERRGPGREGKGDIQNIPSETPSMT